ncbi:MAG: hypothetical protein CM1200mP28_09580 [Deltaproteobacteria bacterium]|nr:MAG: hypothetical protein CM1200mP28_09580 [Deltaproteobacteria bacterium]
MRLNVNSAAKDKKEVIFATTGGKEFNPELPAIIFLHCAGADHSIWYLQTRYFAYHGYSILAVDFPGHGRSEGELIKSIEEMADWIPGKFSAPQVLNRPHLWDIRWEPWLLWSVPLVFQKM